MAFRFLLALFFFLPPAWAAAQQEPADAPPSVYRVSPVIDGAITAGTDILTLAAFAFDGQLINKRCPCDPNEVNSFDRPAIYNSSETARALAGATVGLSIVAPIFIDYLDVKAGPAFIEDTFIYLETMSISWFLVTATKFATQRPLPRLYAAGVQGEPTDYLSFYSGHTTTVVTAMTAFSMTWTLRHGPSVWPWVATGLLGGSVGYEMVASAGHFPSDVIVGAGVGAAVGYLVPHLHEKKRRSDASLEFIPMPGGGLALWSQSWD